MKELACPNRGQKMSGDKCPRCGVTFIQSVYPSDKGVVIVDSKTGTLKKNDYRG